MRITALHLLAYGPFTDRSLFFGDEPSLHVIYGDNEAGKSTTLRALSSVLFGYPHEVVDGYKFDAKDIALGIELLGKDGQTLSFQRRRRGKQALARADGTTLDDAVVSKMLGGVSREVFEKVFALDHHRLHDNARALLLEGGSLGFTLAAAGSGISGLRATLDRLKGERAALFLPSGSKPKLNQRIAQLGELRKEARRRSVSLAEYKKRQNEINEVETALTEARARGRAIESQSHKLDRIARNLPLRARHNAVLGRLDTLGSTPLLATDASQKRVKAETDRDLAEVDLAQADGALAALESELSRVTLDQVILDKSAAIEALAEDRAVIEDADRSLPRRDAEREQHYATARDLLGKAELSGSSTELASLLPSLVKRKMVLSLAEKGRALTARKEALTEAASVADEDVRLARERLVATQAPADMTALTAALLIGDTLGDIRDNIVSRSRALAVDVKTTREGIVGLGPSDGDASALRKMSMPSDETVARFRQTFAATEAEQIAQSGGIARLREDLAGMQTRIDELSLGGTVVTIEELQDSRASRDQVWSVLRGIYIDGRHGLEDRAQALAGDGDLAGAFESHQADADSAADVIIAHKKEAVELSLTARRKSEMEAKMAAANANNEALQARYNALVSDWVSMWPLETGRIRSPVEMVQWLARRETLLRDDIQQQGEAQAIAELETKELLGRETLLSALKPVATAEENATLSLLRTQARGLVNSAAAAATKHAKAVEALESGQQRKRQADATRDRIGTQIMEWLISWKTALQEAGMKETLSIDGAAAVLDIMTALDTLKPQIDELSHRIQTMKDNKAEFEAAIALLGALVPWPPGSATEASRRLETRLKAAKVTEASIHNLGEQRKIRTEARRQATERLARSKAALAALCVAAGCEDAGTLSGIEQDSVNKREAIREREQLETRMLEEGSGLSLEALVEECEGVDGDTLPGQITALKEENIELEAAIEAMMAKRASLQAAFDALFGQNQAAEALQDAANVEAEIAMLTQAYVDLAVQEVTLRRAIDLYRDRNQGPILNRAKALFAQLTNGAYSGLRADIDERDEAILIAEHATRGSLEVTALSDGTVDPLYLALRLAVVTEHNAQHEPLPFVADDLLLSLDNARAQATLRALVDLAKSDQVLFFTHNEHIAELARRAVPPDLLKEHRL